MNRLSQTLATSLLGALVLSALLSHAPRDAHACSPPQQGIFANDMSIHDAPIPLNGGFTFTVRRYEASFDLLSITVTNAATGAVAPGNFTQTPMGTGGAIGADDNGNFLIVWTPTNPLAPNTSYSVTVTASDPHDPSQITTFPSAEFISGTGRAEAIEASTFAADSLLEIVEVPGGQECCDDATVCEIGDCSSCTSCWFTRYDYLPSVTVKLARPRQGDHFQVYHKLISSSGSFEVIPGGSSLLPRTLLFSHDDPGPYCLVLETYQLNSQTLNGSDEICFERGQFPEHDVREYTGDGRPDTCDDETTDPDAGPETDASSDASSDADTTKPSDDDILDESDIAEQDATHTPDIGSDAPDTDAENAFNGSVTGGGCGCASTSTSPTPLAGLLLFLGALVGLRRRAAR